MERVGCFGGGIGAPHCQKCQKLLYIARQEEGMRHRERDREWEREWERESESEWERDRERECVFVCVCVRERERERVWERWRESKSKRPPNTRNNNNNDAMINCSSKNCRYVRPKLQRRRGGGEGEGCRWLRRQRQLQQQRLKVHRTSVRSITSFSGSGFVSKTWRRLVANLVYEGGDAFKWSLT